MYTMRNPIDLFKKTTDVSGGQDNEKGEHVAHDEHVTLSNLRLNFRQNIPT